MTKPYTLHLTFEADEDEDARAKAKAILDNLSVPFTSRANITDVLTLGDDWLWPVVAPVVDYMFVYTNAPESYDYGYTSAGAAGLNIEWRGKTLRCVMIPTSHVEYQTGRYQSGLYVAFRGVSVSAAKQAAEAF